MLIVPVESRVRELDGKLLLAAAAAERGFSVVLGSRPFISFALPKLPRGVFFAKSMRFTSDLMTGFILGHGHHMVASDEESLVRFRHPDYEAWRFSARSFSALRHLFSWGQDDAALFRRYPGRGDVAVHVTGNPRMDLLRPELRCVYDADADALRRRFGRFILINTNFSFVNNFVPGLNLVRRASDDSVEVGRTGRGMSLDFALGMARHQQTLLDAFARALPALARAFPKHHVILRPHPSEDHERWRRLTAALGNVQVIHQGSVVPWLLAADVLVHNGCTTAVEAAVLGTPAVAFRPVVSAAHDYHLPNRLSLQCPTTTDLIAAVGDVFDGRSRAISACDRVGILSRHLEFDPGRLAADRIIDVLVERGYMDGPLPPPPLSDRAYAALGTRVRTLVKQINLRRKGHRNGVDYLRHRFEPLSVDEVQQRIGTLGRATGRFGSVRARALGRDLYSIESASAAPRTAVSAGLRP